MSKPPHTCILINTYPDLVMVSNNEVKQSSVAFKFLKQVIELTNREIPNLKREVEYLPSLHEQIGSSVAELMSSYDLGTNGYNDSATTS